MNTAIGKYAVGNWAAEAAAGFDQGKPDATTETILLVEDDANDVFFMEWAATRAGLVNPIQVANDGLEAIDYFKGSGRFANREDFPLPRLVLLDLKLPCVMGLEVLEWIRQQPDLAPLVIVLSSSEAEVDIAAAHRLGANGFLVKPCRIEELVGMLETIKDRFFTQSHTAGFGSKPAPSSLFTRVGVQWTHPHHSSARGREARKEVPK